MKESRRAEEGAFRSPVTAGLEAWPWQPRLPPHASNKRTSSSATNVDKMFCLALCHSSALLAATLPLWKRYMLFLIPFHSDHIYSTDPRRLPSAAFQGFLLHHLILLVFSYKILMPFIAPATYLKHFRRFFPRLQMYISSSYSSLYSTLEYPALMFLTHYATRKSL